MSTKEKQVPMGEIKTMEFNITRTIPASPAEVYDAWLDPKLPVNPWHGGQKLDFTPRPGALWFFMHVMNGTELPHYGRFDVLERPSRIQLSWMSRHTRGLESVVTVTLKPKGDETILTLKHANIPDDEMGHAHDEGWTSLTSKLEERFATARA